MGAVGEDLVGIAALTPTREGTECAPCSGLKGKAIGDARPFKTGISLVLGGRCFPKTSESKAQPILALATPPEDAPLSPRGTDGHVGCGSESVTSVCRKGTRVLTGRRTLYRPVPTRREGYSGRPRGRGK